MLAYFHVPRRHKDTKKIELLTTDFTDFSDYVFASFGVFGHTFPLSKLL